MNHYRTCWYRCVKYTAPHTGRHSHGEDQRQVYEAVDQWSDDRHDNRGDENDQEGG